MGRPINFLASRLTFHRPDGSPGPSNAGGPSCLLAWGACNVLAIQRVDGIFVRDPREAQPRIQMGLYA